jgi:uncharacterized DUF497 family protein
MPDAPIRYQFEWDATKAAANEAKHGVTFPNASQVFRDPNALSIYEMTRTVKRKTAG